MAVRAHLSDRISIAIDETPEQALALIRSALSFTNEEREAARKDRRWGWQDMPTTIDLWEERDGKLLLPRGFATQLEHGLKVGYDLDVAWEKDLSYGDRANDLRLATAVKTFPYQDRALDKLWPLSGWIWEAPPGAGKTVTMLEYIRRKGVKALVITDRVHLVEQWRREAAKHMGFEGVGFIGGGSWDVEADITIALRHTLWSRILELDAVKFWRRFGITVIDEVHHLSSETLQEIISRTTSADLCGVSATVARTRIKGQMVQAIVGPIAHVTTEEELQQAGRLIKPKVIEIPTNFEFPYHGSVQVGAMEECPVQGCRRPPPHGHRNNWAKMLSALVRDVDRQMLFSSVVEGDRGHHHLVLSRQKGHLESMNATLNGAIEFFGSEAIPTFMLTGAEELAQRMEIYDVIDSLEESVLFTTLGDEALDIPILDRLHLVFPVQAREEAALLRQQIGRILRVHECKDDAVIYDYRDQNVGVLLSQSESRRMLYRRKGYRIENLLPRGV